MFLTTTHFNEFLYSDIYLSLEYVEIFLHLRLRHNGLIVINYST